LAEDALLAHFAASRPEEMANALSAADSESLTTFLRDLPAGADAMVAARLPSWQLSHLLHAMAPADIARLLLDASTDDAVAIVAHMPETRYAGVLEAAPENQRDKLGQLLAFPSHSLASLASAAFVRAAGHTPCRDLGRQLSQRSEPVTGPVVIVDASGRYLGLVEAHALYRQRNAGRTLGEVAAPVAPFSGATDIGMALNSRLWARYPDLPVVDHRQRLLGVVNRAALLRVAGSRELEPYSVERLFTDLAIGYLDTCGQVVESLLGRPK